MEPDTTKKKPKSGQSAPLSVVPPRSLNSKEMLLLIALEGAESMRLDDLAKLFEADVPDIQKRRSWARNSLRRLISGTPQGETSTWVSKVSRGLYCITDAGRQALRAWIDEHPVS